MSIVAIGAILLGGCRESDDGFHPDGLGVDATVTGFPATLQAGENQRPQTPDFPPEIDEAATLAEESIREDFAGRSWVDAMVEVRAANAAMVMVLDPAQTKLTDEALLEACTALAGRAFAETGLDPAVIEARVEDIKGKELKSTTGPQCI